MSSLRASLIRWLVGSFALLLALGGSALYHLYRQASTATFDSSLRTRAWALATLTKYNAKGELELDFAEEVMTEYAGGPHSAYFEVWQPDGRVLERSPELGAVDLSRRTAVPGRHQVWDTPLPDGRAGRAMEMDFVPQLDDEAPRGPAHLAPKQRAVVVVAVERYWLDAMLHACASVVTIFSAVMLAGSVLIAWWVSRRALQPLHELAERVRAIDAGTLHFRLGEKRLPAELQPIAHRLNELLERLQAAFARERHFSADVAHELRTPVAELRTLAEVALKWPPGEAEARQNFTDVLAAAQHMSEIVGGLLLTARCESGVEEVTRETFDLVPLIQEACAAAFPKGHRCEPKRLQLGGPALVASDRALLRILLFNFFTNAAEHRPAQGQVAISLEQSKDIWKFRLENDAPDLSPEDMPHLVERFWRKSTARTATGRSGLGLSIARAVSLLLAAPLAFRLSAEGTFIVELDLPAAAQVESAPFPAAPLSPSRRDAVG